MPDMEGQTTESRLGDYAGAMVTLYYNVSSYSDNGRITYLDTHWIELTKDNGERLLSPVNSVRLVKLLENPKRDPDAEILLRPVDTKPIETQNETRRLNR